MGGGARPHGLGRLVLLLFLFPIGDENPRESPPYVTYSLLGVLAAFTLAFSAGAPDSPLHRAAEVLPGHGSFGSFWIAPFCAASVFDAALAGLFLWIFADNVEDRLGAPRFVGAFLAWTWLGVGAHLLFGGTGAAFRGPAYGVTGVVGAYVTFFPKHYVRLINLFPVFFSLRSTLGRLGYGQPTFHYVTAPWAAAVWVGLLAVAIAAGWSHASVVALLVSGLAGVGTAWAGKALLRIRVADPTLPEELAPPVIRRERAALRAVEAGPAAKDGGKAGAPAPSRGSPAAAGGERTSFLEIDAPEGAAGATAEELPTTGLTGCAVIRLTEDLFDVSLLGRVVAGRTGEYLGDVTRRIRVTRGLLVRGVERDVAEKIVADLAAHAVEAAIVDLARVPQLPPPQRIAGAGSGPAGCVFALGEGGERVTLPWSRIGLIAAGQIESKRSVLVPAARAAMESIEGVAVMSSDRVERVKIDTVVDFVLRAPAGRLRLYKEDVHFRLMNEAEVETAMAGERGFKQFVRTIVESRGSTPINTGVKVLDRGGKWGYLRFVCERDFDDYCWWLYQLLAARRAPARTESFLE